MYVDFASTESTNFGLKIFGKKKQKTIPESPKKQNLNLLCAGNYLHSFYTVFATIYIAFMSH